MKLWTLSILIILLNACSGSNSTPPIDTQKLTYQLMTKFTGDERSLGIEIDSNVVSQPIMVNSSENTNPRWEFVRQGDDLYRISPHSSNGETVLTVQMSGDLINVALAPLSNSDNDLWQVTPLGDGYCRLTSQLLGQGSSLDIVNDDEDNKLKMAISGNETGQAWQLEMITGSTVDDLLSPCIGGFQSTQTQTDEFEPTANYRRTKIRDFSLLISPDAELQPQLLTDAITEIDSQLTVLESTLSVDVFNELKQVPIWIESEQLPNTAGQFHNSVGWLENNGYNSDKVGSVEISNLQIFVERSRSQISSPLIHELTHARWFYLDDKSAPLESTYQLAVASTMYDSVLNANGSMEQAYAITNSLEYLAELSEAYFAINDFFPFYREELRTFDPDGYRLVTQVWEIDEL